MKKLLITFSLCTLFAGVLAAGPFAPCGSVSGNLVSNCGFETGTFVDWGLSGNGGFISIITNPVNTGQFAASFGAVGSDTILSQGLTGGAGTYLISFYLANDGGTPNDFNVSLGGNSVYSVTDLGGFGFTNYQFTTTVGAANPTLAFGFRQDPAYFQFDDVVVLQTSGVPEPATFGMLLGGIGVALLARRRRKA